MLGFFSYLLTPILFLGTGLGAYYLYNPQSAKGMLVYATWNAAGYYVKMLDYFNPPDTATENKINKTDSVVEKENDSESKKVSQSLVYYIENEKNTYQTDVRTRKSVDLIKASKPLLLFLKTKYKDMEYYKRTKNPLATYTEYLTLDERPFIQVEFIEKDKKPIDIHGHLSGFYVEENVILDTAFLKWYLSYFYKIHSFGNYTLKIFDKDVNMFTLDETQYIRILKDTYHVGTLPFNEETDEDTNDEGTDEYESTGEEDSSGEDTAVGEDAAVNAIETVNMALGERILKTVTSLRARQVVSNEQN